ncbi:hypothetical protein LCGC14_0992600 [marine sediment metagenome]|uniref:OB domain-containing protein n=1 Tax=marine sediment metagenome TaxID=412755 RepID=A0A0F9QNV0_9ZZZZ
MIKDLEPNTRFGAIELTIVAKEPPRFLKDDNFNGLRSVAIGRDSTGEIKITLWENEASEVELGDRIRITDGHVDNWMGDKVLSSGRFGYISIIVDDEVYPMERGAKPGEKLPGRAAINMLVQEGILKYDDACPCSNCETIATIIDRI